VGKRLRACPKIVSIIQTGLGVRERGRRWPYRWIPLVGNVVVVHRGHPLFCTTLTAAKTFGSFRQTFIRVNLTSFSQREILI
jgi:hypothetical protein